jgi:hypothetical protein
MGIEIGTKQVICTITFKRIKSFSCDLFLSQKVPSDSGFGIYGGKFERIWNQKILQIEANEGEWGMDISQNILSFLKKDTGIGFLNLNGIPLDFMNKAILDGVELTGQGWIWMPPNELTWRIVKFQ